MATMNDVMCVTCGGSGVNLRLPSKPNCIPCRGKGFLSPEDQVREDLFQASQKAKADEQRLANLKRFRPAIYEQLMKQQQTEQEAAPKTKAARAGATK